MKTNMATKHDTITVSREGEITNPSITPDFEHIPFGTQVYSESDPLGVQALRDVESTVEQLEGTIQTLENSFNQISIPTKITDLDNDGGFVTESSLSGLVSKADLSEGIEFGEMNVTDLTINGNRPIAIPNNTLDTAIDSIQGATDLAGIKTALVTLFTEMKTK